MKIKNGLRPSWETKTLINGWGNGIRKEKTWADCKGEWGRKGENTERGRIIKVIRKSA